MVGDVSVRIMQSCSAAERGDDRVIQLPSALEVTLARKVPRIPRHARRAESGVEPPHSKGCRISEYARRSGAGKVLATQVLQRAHAPSATCRARARARQGTVETSYTVPDLPTGSGSAPAQSQRHQPVDKSAGADRLFHNGRLSYDPNAWRTGCPGSAAGGTSRTVLRGPCGGFPPPPMPRVNKSR